MNLVILSEILLCHLLLRRFLCFWDGEPTASLCSSDRNKNTTLTLMLFTRLQKRSGTGFFKMTSDPTQESKAENSSDRPVGFSTDPLSDDGRKR